MEIYVVLYDGSVSTIAKSFEEAKQYVCREEMIDEYCDDWTEEDFKRYAEEFNREAFVDGSAEYLGWWRIEKVKLPFDVLSWIRNYPTESIYSEEEEQYAEEIARYESMCGSAEDDYYARCCDAWQEGENI